MQRVDHDQVWFFYLTEGPNTAAQSTCKPPGVLSLAPPGARGGEAPPWPRRKPESLRINAATNHAWIYRTQEKPFNMRKNKSAIRLKHLHGCLRLGCQNRSQGSLGHGLWEGHTILFYRPCLHYLERLEQYADRFQLNIYAVYNTSEAVTPIGWNEKNLSEDFPMFHAMPWGRRTWHSAPPLWPRGLKAKMAKSPAR